jgi:hypothetical protein
MSKIRMTVFGLMLALLPLANVYGQVAQQSFGFNAQRISGFPSGAAFLTGGGAYNLERAFLKTGGGFRCLEDINQGPLNGCRAGEGIRWDAKDGRIQLLESFTFKCTGAVSEARKTVETDDNTVVMFAESFTAHMFVSAVDEAPDLPGVQNAWIEGVGCGTAIANLG